MIEPDLTRRTFFTSLGRLVVLVPAGWMVLNAAACGSDSNPDCATSDTVILTADALVVTSTCTGGSSGHEHDFTVMNTDLATPPDAGVSGNSSAYDDDLHVHTVALTQTDLTNIQAGQTVPVESGSTLNHTHVFNFRKA